MGMIGDPRPWMLGVMILLAGTLAGCAWWGGPDGGVPLCKDDAVREYADILRSQNERARSAVPRLAELMRRLAREQALIVTPDWRQPVSDQLSSIVHASQQVRLLRKPRRELQAAHRLFRDAYDAYGVGAEALHQGLLANDAPTALAGFRTLRQGTEPFEQARRRLGRRLGPCPWYSGAAR